MTVVLNNLPGAISEVIEELALMSVNEPEEEYTLKGEVVGSVDFVGPFRGRLSAKCDRKLAVVFASNLLGVERESHQASEKTCDAFGEMLNILCGNLVTKLFGSQHAFSLSMPTCVQLTDEELTSSTLEPVDGRSQLQQERCVFMLDDEPIEFTLDVEAEH